MKSVIAKTKAVIFATVLMAGTLVLTPSFASNGKGENPDVVISYVGLKGNNPTFKINFNNNETDNFIVTIKDREGNIIYSEKIRGKKVSRTYQIDTEEYLEEGALRFEVRSLKHDTTEVYVAGIKENVSRTMAVSKL